MEWVEGEPLIAYVEKNLSNPSALFSLALRLADMTNALKNAGIAHGDLQHGNVLVVNGQFRLVDYDAMYVPGLAGRTSPEKGQRNYQHPQRSELDYDVNLDNFSSWVIYVSLIALAVEPQLWKQFRGGDDCLIFRQSDFEDPEKSALLKLLERSSDQRLRSLAVFFSSILDLGPGNVPALDGQIVPVSRTAPNSGLNRPNWLNDYVQLVPQQQSQRVAITSDDLIQEQSVSWIHDFIAPQVSASIAETFRNSPSADRIIGAISLVFILGALLLRVRDLISLADFVFALSSGAAINCSFWFIRFRSDEIFAARKVRVDELNEIDRRVSSLRSALKVSEADAHSLQHRLSEEQQNISKQLQRIREEEEKEGQGARATLQAEVNSTMSRRGELTRQESDALQKISTTIGSQVQMLTSDIADLLKRETSEIANALATKREGVISGYLRNWHIADASIPGIGPGFKARLRTAGIINAADVNVRVLSVPGFGQTRASALFAWQRPLKLRAEQTAPKTLSFVEEAAIKAKYEGKRLDLVTRKEVSERQFRDAENAIRTTYASLKQDLQSDELIAKRKADSRMKEIESKYKLQYSEVFRRRAKIEEDTKRGTGCLTEKAGILRKELFSRRWEHEKVRRTIVPFRNVSFAGYLRHIMGI
jgi:hypothetical protein